MTTYHQDEQAERREVLENEKRLREQGSTFAQFAASEADTPRGRFAAHERATVIGSEPIVRYPQLPASSPWAGPDPVPTEAPLNLDVNAMEPCGEPHELKASAPTLEPPTPFSSAQGNSGDPTAAPPSNPLAGAERVGSPPFTDDDEPPRAA
jgi:hypothetical protein